MRLLHALVTFALVLSVAGAEFAYSDALHAPRIARGKYQVTTPAGCTGATGTNPRMYSEQARHQAYVCRNGGGTSAFLFDSRRRNSRPVFSIGEGNADILWVSSKATKLAVISDVPLTGTPLNGAWGLYVYTRQSQRMELVLEDDPTGLEDLIGDSDCPGDEIVSLGPPTVEHLNNRGKMIVRLPRATESGPCPGLPIYMQVLE